MSEYARLHKKPRSIADDEYYLAHYVPAGWRARHLSDISRADVERLHASLGEERGIIRPTTLCASCVTWLARVNAALLEEPYWRWRAYFPLALMLGTRKSELRAMRWVDIDLIARTWRIPETKMGNTHLLPLPGPALAISNRCRPTTGRSGCSRAMAPLVT